MRHVRNSLLLLFLFPLWVPSALAERADRNKPIHMEADQVTMDDARQISTFSGNVQMSQGTMLIRGDRIVIRDEGGYKVGTAYGKTASFRQKREGLEEYVEGYGERIVYDTRTESVDFYVQARVKRDLDEVRGEHITYSQKTEIFQVNSGAATGDGAPPGRVRAILQPKPKEDAASAQPDGMPITPSESLALPERQP